MPDPDPVDEFFDQLSQLEQAASRRTPSRLKSRVFTALTRSMQNAGGLCSLSESCAHGHALCVFEKLVEIAPISEDLKTKNPCEVCHARIAGERIEGAFIFWPGCPYSRFQNR